MYTISVGLKIRGTGAVFVRPAEITNPYSVMHAVGFGKFRSYWKKTSAAETLMTVPTASWWHKTAA